MTKTSLFRCNSSAMSKRKADQCLSQEDVPLDLIGKAKTQLMKQLTCPVEGKEGAEATRVRAVLDSCFQEKVSGSVLIVGSEGSGKRQFADQLLESYKTPSGEDIKVARLQGLAFSKDNLALISLARQLGIFSETDNFNMSVEGLQSHFQQSRLQNVPTVILIEAIDEFTKRSRQVLLYTLLDLMHRPDLYYVVVGLSHRIDITSLLEKRVTSRLSAQCVYLKPRTAPETSQILLSKLHLSVQNIDYNNSEVLANFVKEYNECLATTLGPRPLKSIGKSQDSCRVAELLSQKIAWGKDISYFIAVAQLAVMRLDQGCPFLTQDLFKSCFSQMEVPDMESIISSLPTVELYVLVAAIRLHTMRCGNADSLPIVQKDGSRVLKAKGISGFNVEQLLEETEKLTGVLRKKIVLKRQLFNAVSSLARDARLIQIWNGKQFQFAKSGEICEVLETSQVLLNHSLLEFQSSFRNKSLQIPDKLRKATLDPLDPMSYASVLPLVEGGENEWNVSVQLV